MEKHPRAFQSSRCDLAGILVYQMFLKIMSLPVWHCRALALVGGRPGRGVIVVSFGAFFSG